MERFIQSTFIVLFLLLVADLSACTVPVFRFALDQWTGINDEAIGDNPISQEIAQRMLTGNSAVWILVNSGNQAADEEMFEKLQARLKFFESVAELPKIDPDDPSSRLGPGPKLEIRFSIIRIDRNHPIVPNLVGPKANRLNASAAWVAPVFGRGRVLGVWDASQMDEEGIDEACFYLTGACSCQVKVQNPGWDIPINVDWDKRLRESDVAITSAQLPAQAAPAAEEVMFSHVIVELKLAPILAVIILIAGIVLLWNSRKSKSI